MSLVPSEYPSEAVEFTVTFLIPVTDENRRDVDGAAHDLLTASGLTWWPDRIAHYVDNRQVLMYGFNRPPQLKRPRPSPRKRTA